MLAQRSRTFFLVLQAPVAKKKLTSSTFKKSLANIIYPKQISGLQIRATAVVLGGLDLQQSLSSEIE